jgi:hypothetical protein
MYVYVAVTTNTLCQKRGLLYVKRDLLHFKRDLRNFERNLLYRRLHTSRVSNMSVMSPTFQKRPIYRHMSAYLHGGDDNGVFGSNERLAQYVRDDVVFGSTSTFKRDLILFQRRPDLYQN